MMAMKNSNKKCVLFFLLLKDQRSEGQDPQGEGRRLQARAPETDPTRKGLGGLKDCWRVQHHRDE